MELMLERAISTLYNRHLLLVTLLGFHLFCQPILDKLHIHAVLLTRDHVRFIVA